MRGVLHRPALAALARSNNSGSLILVGNTGSAFWPIFTRSVEYADGLEHPLDRWSRRIGQQVVDTLSEVGITASVLFPFDGPPYVPFQQFALEADAIEPSALGMLIHPDYGLWHAYRFAVLVDEEIPTSPAKSSRRNLCASCQEKPCLDVCPVGAFTREGYDVQSCASYLAANPDAPCLTNGCLARHACPEGSAHHYTQAHAEFHMRAFLRARLSEIDAS